ncbi:MAG: transglutaminase family protein [Phascolarctobacterium sp.]|nr:transglutaminase family protein [Phascolarctobacterium sp.]
MIKWRLSYDLNIKFSGPVTDHHFSLRCLPVERTGQHVKDIKLTINPDVHMSLNADAFGNQYVWGRISEAHDKFSFHVEAEVDCVDEYLVETKAEHTLGQYKSTTPLTTMSKDMEDFLQNLHLENFSNDLDKVDALNKAVWGHILYTPGSTSVNTSAAEAFAQGKGVCQDYAHVLLALLRRKGYLARYVAGAINGEGESHAWTEVLLGGRWVPLDPTHCRRANEYYIAFAVGRDANEANLSKGVFQGFVTQEQKVIVKMEAY